MSAAAPADRVGDEPLLARLVRGGLLVASFLYAIAIFLIVASRLDVFPPTEAVGIGRVTLDGISKMRDYATAALFFLVVPFATWGFSRAGCTMADRFRRSLPPEDHARPIESMSLLASLLPFTLAPFWVIATTKPLWGLLLPPILAHAVLALVVLHRRRPWFRELFAPHLGGVHALLLVEASAWLLYRYLRKGTWIARDPTLFLEVTFILLFLALFAGAAILIARLAGRLLGVDAGDALRSVASGAIPLTLLPVAGLSFSIPDSVAMATIAISILAAVAAVVSRKALPATALRRLLIWVLAPFVIYCGTYASVASPWHWVDLFHRGESLGPASDYLRGKIPYRDVFVLHGLLDDGFADALLMRAFGRDPTLSTDRIVVLSSATAPLLWFLGVAMFRSIPLALLVVAGGFVVSGDNQRALLELATVTLLIAALRRGSERDVFPGRPLLTLLAGAAAALALFQSLDIGMYSIAGGVLAIPLVHLFRRRAGEVTSGAGKHFTAFILGIAIGTAPFVVWLVARGAFTPFLRDSFVVVPSIIDAIWSLPWPPLGAEFTRDLSLVGISRFVLSEKMRYLIPPLVLAAASTLLLLRFVRRAGEPFGGALLILTIFGGLTQRSAVGRADFPHQYFAAFLVGPLLVALLVLLFRHLASLWRNSGDGGRAFVLLFSSMVIAGVSVLLWIPDLFAARLDEVVRYRARMAGAPNLAHPDADRVSERIIRIRSGLDQSIGPDEPWFDFTNQPALYFHMERPNPTRFYQVPILSPIAFQREAILALEESHTPLVLVPIASRETPYDGIGSESRAPGLAAYLRDRYRFLMRRSGVELRLRKEGLATIDLEHYLQLARQPPATSRVTSWEWLVFPAIASISGAEGARWRTDLAVQNPNREATLLRLRYGSGDSREALVEIAAGSTKRLDDVVTTLFHAPETLGPLWIEHPAAAVPIIRATTYDASREGKRFAVRAAGQADVLTAGKPAAIRLPEGNVWSGTLRILSLGETAAVVRLTGIGGDGQPMSQPVEHEVEEGEMFQLRDVETLGDVLRIEVLKGEIVAEATVVERKSGDAMTIRAEQVP
ncbi:MAG TPA: hypothetical protein VMT00_04000 [Thermoanaerobaculia bacterium]|nr:hypothetical protein [Thermoanaerobaculia bacterium]